MPKTREEVLKDIQEHPENHIHNFDELTACCLVDRALNLSLMEAHSKFVDLRANPVTKCDVTEGPCACGAWHRLDENFEGDYKGFPTRKEYLESLNKKK